MVVAPTFVHLAQVQGSLAAPLQAAAQNIWVGKGGAFTGEVAAEMLADLGVGWVILGHSERRALLGESSEFVGRKVDYALANGLSVIACIGETLAQRESGEMYNVLAEQLKWVAGGLVCLEGRSSSSGWWGCSSCLRLVQGGAQGPGLALQGGAQSPLSWRWCGEL